MRSARLLFAAACAVALMVPAAAQTVIAQHDYTGLTGLGFVGFGDDAPYGENVVAQTFVPTTTATVQSIDVAVARRAATDVAVSFEIRSTYDAGLPNGVQPDFSVAALSTGSLLASDPQWSDESDLWRNVPMTSCVLQAGQTYAIVSRTAAPYATYSWFEPSGLPDYADGALMAGLLSGPALGEQTGRDVPFRVYGADAPPEPTPAEAVQDLQATVDEVVAAGAAVPAAGHALIAKLDTALACLDAGDTAGAVDCLTAFCNQVRALVRAGRLTSDAADVLLQDAADIISALTE